MIIISPHGNTAFDTKEIEAVYRLKNDKTHRISNIIGIGFKSGNVLNVECKTSKEAKKFIDDIIKIITTENYGK